MMEKKTTIKNWQEEDRPREKLLRNGEHTLSNAELVAILLRNGTHGKSAVDLARSILHHFKSFRRMSRTDLRDWKTIRGLGEAKISQLRAAIEIGRRFAEEKSQDEKFVVHSSKEAAELLIPRMRDLKKEVFKVMALNSQNQMITITEITQGTVNEAQPVLREIFENLIKHCASSFLCFHNHPSGNPTPSSEDKSFTQKLLQASLLMQIPLLDHIIIGDNCYFSFADEGLI